MHEINGYQHDIMVFNLIIEDEEGEICIIYSMEFMNYTTAFFVGDFPPKEFFFVNLN